MRLPRPSADAVYRGAVYLFALGMLAGAALCSGCAPWWGCKGDDCLGAKQAAMRDGGGQ